MASKHEEKKHLAFLKTGIRAYEAKIFDLNFVEQQGLSVKLLLAYAYHKDHQIAFRAAWLLEHTFLKTPACIVPIYDEFMERLPGLHNWSCIRSFTKIGMSVSKMSNKIVQSTSEQEEIWIARCFDWIIAGDCPVAVCVNCLDILHHLSAKYDWIKEELAAQITYLLRNPTPALASRAKRILKRIL